MTAAAAPIGAGVRPAPPSHLRRDLAALGVGLVFLWAIIDVGVRLDRLVDLPAKLAVMFGRMFLPPDWSYLRTSLEAMVVSVQMAWFGTLIGAVLSLPLGFLAARNVSGRASTAATRLLLDAIRAFPEIVLVVVVFIPIAGLGPFAGALAIGVHSVGTLGKLTAEAVEGIDPGPVEAARASGARGVQVQRWGVLPQVLPEVVAFWLYRFEINLRAAAAVGIAGAGGIGFVVENTLRYNRFGKAGMAILVVVVATILVDAVSGAIRRRIIEGGAPAARPAIEEPRLEPASLGR